MNSDVHRRESDATGYPGMEVSQIRKCSSVRPLSSTLAARRVSWASHNHLTPQNTRGCKSAGPLRRATIVEEGDIQSGNSPGEINQDGHDSRMTSFRRHSRSIVIAHETGREILRRRKTLSDVFSSGKGKRRETNPSARPASGGGFERSPLRSRSLGGALDVMMRLAKWRVSCRNEPTDKPSKAQAILWAKFRCYLNCVTGFLRLFTKVKILQRESPEYSTQMEVIGQSEGVSIDKKHFMFFDPSEYKAIQQLTMTKQVKQILGKSPEYRTHQDIQYAMIALRAIPMIADYPVNMQRMLATRGRFASCEAGRMLIKQKHLPYCFYIILFGSVIVCVHDEDKVRAQTKCYLRRGETFGDLAIVARTARQSTVITRTYSEFLVIDAEVYENIFLVGGGKNLADPAHVEFMNSLAFLRQWPIHLLVNDPKTYVVNFFRRGSIIMKNSTNSKWIYTIKSGSVRVLKMLSDEKPTIDRHSGRDLNRPPKPVIDPFYHVKGKENTWNHNYTCGSRCRVDNYGYREQMTKLKRKSNRSESTHTNASNEEPHQKKTLADALEDNNEENCRIADNPIFVHIQTLTKGESFGLASLLYNDQPSLCLVSNGAECILLNKRCYLKNCPPHALNNLRHQISPYPTEEKLQGDLKIRVNWDAYKEATITQVYSDKADPGDIYPTDCVNVYV